MNTLQDQYSKDVQEEAFAMLVSARVNEIRSGTAAVLNFELIGGLYYTTEQQALMFADKIAQAVCANLDRKDK
jgi:hypothetical protein